MGIPEIRLSCRLDGLTAAAREQQRLLVLTELGLLDTEVVPIFEEATQTAAHSIGAPISLISVIDQSRQWFKSAVGLSRLGLMNDLALSRQLPREQSFCVYVVDSQQVLAIEDTLDHPAFAHSLLCQQYGIRAYLGAPLLTTTGECVGTLCVMDSRPRTFTERDIEFLLLTARLSMSEYERLNIVKAQAVKPGSGFQPVDPNPSPNPIKFELLAQLTQELRTPLTSVMGMASVLNREIYGPLTSKQKEYLDIIHHSGQYLLSLVKEIIELSQLDPNGQSLSLTLVDIEMVCQQAISTLEQVANGRDQQIRLSVEPGNRIWLLDKEKIRQMLYHLLFSVVESSTSGSIVRLHVSQKGNGLRLTVWTSHPCLGDGLGYHEMLMPQTSAIAAFEYEMPNHRAGTGLIPVATALNPPKLTNLDESLNTKADTARKSLGLLLSRQLAELHGGQILTHGSSEGEYRYVITLPRLTQ